MRGTKSIEGLTHTVDCRTMQTRRGGQMTSNLRALALSLDQAAPDLKIAALIQQERQKIEEALATVGEYVLSDDEGRLYVITASAATTEPEPAAVGSNAE